MRDLHRTRAVLRAAQALGSGFAMTAASHSREGHTDTHPQKPVSWGGIKQNGIKRSAPSAPPAGRFSPRRHFAFPAQTRRHATSHVTRRRAVRACVLTSREARARGRVGAAGPAMGEPPRRPRELFLAGLAAAYLAAFVSLYLQIPGKRPGSCCRGMSRGILLPRYGDRGRGALMFP